MSCGASLQQEQAQPHTDPLVGSVIDEKYRLKQPLRSGGMGQIYLAQHLIFDELHALKVIHSQAAGAEEAAQRFLVEANLTRKASQRSDHIVYIHDFGHDPKVGHYIAMEYLKGHSLSMALKPGYEPPLRFDHILGIMVQLCDAIQIAHDLGIIHRDLKPSNIFLVEKHGDPHFVKVLDFGVARANEQLIANYETIGGLVGTPNYMAPEQILAEDERRERGWEFDGRVDVYATGIMLYKALTGRTPFRKKGRGRSSYWEVWRKHLEEMPVPPHEYRPDKEIPPWLSEVVLKALAKDPAERYATMREFGEVLKAAKQRLQQQHPQLALGPLPQDPGTGSFTGASSVSLQTSSVQENMPLYQHQTPPPTPSPGGVMLGQLDEDSPSHVTPSPFHAGALSSFDGIPAPPSYTPSTQQTTDEPTLPKKKRSFLFVFLLSLGVTLIIGLVVVYMMRPKELIYPEDMVQKATPLPRRHTKKVTITKPLKRLVTAPKRRVYTIPPPPRQRKQPIKRRKRRRLYGCPFKSGHKAYKLRSLELPLRDIVILADGKTLTVDAKKCIQVPKQSNRISLSYRPDTTEYYPCIIPLKSKKRRLTFKLIDTNELLSKKDCSK
tara:strand:- start:489 stop:2312 length:1824 start_codon:yes stop_codon:yes gene_type:complete